MKKISFLICFCFLLSCTSNTIFKEPKNLIPKDTMSLLIQELMIASSAKNFKNKKFKNKINYIPLVYNKFKIDSVRFKESNFYYASKIDVYKQIIENAKNTLDIKTTKLINYKIKKDSIVKDSLERISSKKIDSTEK